MPCLEDLETLALRCEYTQGTENNTFIQLSQKDYLKSPELFTKSPYNPKTSACIDFVYHTYKRHKGNKAHAKAYLSWEKKLLKRIDPSKIQLNFFLS